MNSHVSDRPDLDETRHLVENEVGMLASAIDLVASGAARRVTLSGLHFGEQLTARFAGEAARVGIRLEPIYWPDDSGLDLLVRLDDDE